MPREGRERCRPADEDVVGVNRVDKDGDDWKVCNEGLELGVGGTSGTVLAKLS